jgi:single-strand DNA-binding protein
MANLNKVILIGRIVADPEAKDIVTFSNGGKMTRLRFVVNNRKFDAAKQDWVDDPVWLDLKFFNRGENGKLADRAAALRKPQQICLEGHLVLEKWTDKDGQERNKILVYVDSFQLLDRRDDGSGGGGSYGEGASMGGGNRPAQRTNTPSKVPARTGGGNGNGGYSNGGGGGDEEPFDPSPGTDEDIPF